MFYEGSDIGDHSSFGLECWYVFVWQEIGKSFLSFLVLQKLSYKFTEELEVIEIPKSSKTFYYTLQNALFKLPIELFVPFEVGDTKFCI